MPLPNPQVLLAFLNAYPKVKEKQTEESFFESAKSTLSNLSQLVSTSQMQADRKLAEDHYRAKIPITQSIEGWLEIAAKLGEDARTEQYRKKSAGDSVLAYIYQLMRAYIIYEIKRDKHFQRQYEAQIALHLAELNVGIQPHVAGGDIRPSLDAVYETEFDQDVDCKSSIGAMVDKMWKLADLGYYKIFSRLTLIDPLKITPEKNRLTFALPTEKELPDLRGGRKNIPLCYQDDFHNFYFMRVISKLYPLTAEQKSLYGISADKQEYILMGDFLESFENTARLQRSESTSREYPSRKKKLKEVEQKHSEDPQPQVQGQAPQPSVSRSTSGGHRAKPSSSAAVIVQLQPSIVPSQSSDVDESIEIKEEVKELPPKNKEKEKRKHKKLPGAVPTPIVSSMNTEEFPLDGSSPWHRSTATKNIAREEELEEKEEKRDTPPPSPSLRSSRGDD